MADTIKVTMVEGGIDQIQTEGDAKDVLSLIERWWGRLDLIRAEATALAAQAGQPPTRGPGRMVAFPPPGKPS